MLSEVQSLISQDVFDVVTEAAPVAVAEELLMEHPIVGQETMLESVWKHLMEDKVNIVGLYGMGGVGKTTLLMQINNKFSEIGDRFDVVIWVLVSKHTTIHKIQEGIGKKLGLVGKEWDEKAESQRALDIHNVLRRKKFVLLLDDIWEKVNLNVIGVPYPSRENRCKVAFTTRSKEVCGRMRVDDPIEVCCLDTEKAWNLFKKNVGENTLESHPDIPEVARKVAGKCRGLPLALNVIGETMSYKRTIQEWRRAIHVLNSSATKFLGMKDEILPILKYSYDSLEKEEHVVDQKKRKGEEHVKSCFLYCSLFPEDYIIKKEMLIDYWICEGFIDENEGRESARNRGYEIIETLVRACLLLLENEKAVKMHDVVREMALWISSDLGENREKCIVQAGLGLCEVPKVENWKNVRRMSLMENNITKISESLECSELTTLLLQKNYFLETISGEFFQSMPRLLVLDLSENYSFRGLPEQISGLVSLRYLDLSRTQIKRLPVGFQELKMLIHLNLERTRELESLQGISNLSSLRTLKLLSSGVRLDMSLMKELQLLEHLEFITITISSNLVGELLLYDPRVFRCIQSISIWDHMEVSVRELVLPATSNLSEINIEYCGVQEIQIEKTPWSKSLTSPYFSNLSHVFIKGCDGLKDLTWLLFAPNLVYLDVEESKQVEDIISEEKAASVLENESCNILPFPKLERLTLQYLPELKSIYWSALPFQRLRDLVVRNCPKLRKLPLDSKSVFNVEEFVIEIGEYSWKERVEWKDDATRDRFLPSCRIIDYAERF